MAYATAKLHGAAALSPAGAGTGQASGYTAADYLIQHARLAVVTSLPTWAIWTLGFGSPALTAAIAFLGIYLSHRASRDLEARSKREEVMRNLRWAAELAVSNDAAKARLGVQELEALRDSKMEGNLSRPGSKTQPGIDDSSGTAWRSLPAMTVLPGTGAYSWLWRGFRGQRYPGAKYERIDGWMVRLLTETVR